MNINTSSARFSPYPSSVEEQVQPKAGDQIEEATSTNSTSESLSAQNQLKFMDQLAQVSMDITRQKLEDNQLLSLQEAEDIIQYLGSDTAIPHLTPCNLIYTETLKLLHQLLGNTSLCKASLVEDFNYKTTKKGSDILKKMLVYVHKIFRSLRNYSKFLNGEKRGEFIEHIAIANTIYIKLMKNYEYLRVISLDRNYQYIKKDTLNLKKQLDLLYHILQNKNLRNMCTNSLCPYLSAEASCLICPLSLEHLSLYETSLKNFPKALVLFQETINRKILLPIQQSLGQIEKLSPEVFKELPLENFKMALIGYIKTLELSDKLQIRPIVDITKKASENKGLKQLKACLHKISTEGLNSITLFKEMEQYACAIYLDWEPLKDSLHKNDALSEKILIQGNTKLEKAIKELEKALSPRKFKNRRIREALIPLIDKLKEILSNKIYVNNYNSIFLETMRLPLLMSSHIQMNFYTWNILQSKATLLHESLLSNQNPCSAFGAFDLVLHLIFYKEGQSTHKEWTPAQQQAFLTLQHALHALFSLQIETGSSRQERLENLVISIKKVCKYLSAQINETDKEATKLKETLGYLNKYLKEFLKLTRLSVENGQISKLVYQHFFATLFSPMTYQDDITVADLLPIKRHMGLLNLGKRLNSDIDLRKNYIQLKASSCPASEQAFWQLNLKCVLTFDLTLQKLSKLINKSYNHLLTCNSIEGAVNVLHEWSKEAEFSLEIFRACSKQLTDFAQFCQRENHLEIADTMYSYALTMSYISYMITAFNDLLSNHRLSEPATNATRRQEKKSNLKAKTYTQLLPLQEAKLPEEVTKAVATEIIHVPKAYEIHLDILENLKMQNLKPLPGETFIDFSQRAIDRKDLINNCFYYLSLIEEEKNWAHLLPSTALIDRSALHCPLLLESTEKICLLMSSISTPTEKQKHILYANNKSLLRSHNGNSLTHLIADINTKWLKERELEPLIASQENLFKYVFWFYEDSKRNVDEHPLKITEACAKVWKALADQKIENFESIELQNQAKQDEFFTRALHKFKRNEQAKAIPGGNFKLELEKFSTLYNKFIQAADCDEQCKALFTEKTQALKRVLALSFALEEHPNYEKMPLFFATRAAEIQISLLSLTLQLALSTCKVDRSTVHPLLLDAQGQLEKRVLKLSHRPKELWEALKAQLPAIASHTKAKFVDEYMGLFNGDPRYPYPNKTIFTDDLTAMQDKVLLLQKVENSLFFSAEEYKQLTQLIGQEHKGSSLAVQKEQLLKSIQKDVAHHQNKLALAFDLAHKILKFMKE